MGEEEVVGASVHETPSETCAEQGVVLIDGPAGTALSMTPRAARTTGRRLVASAEEADSQQPAERRAPDAVSTKPYALIVDDDAFVLMSACDMLSAAGFRFHEAGDSAEALAILGANAPNITLFFTDVEMPGGMNGFELAHVVAERWPDIAIVVASGRMNPGDGELPQKATFIGKPFSEAIVHEHLRRALPDGKQPVQLKKAV